MIKTILEWFKPRPRLDDMMFREIRRAKRDEVCQCSNCQSKCLNWDEFGLPINLTPPPMPPVKPSAPETRVIVEDGKQPRPAPPKPIPSQDKRFDCRCSACGGRS